ncbi:MAG: ChbG/HpnK family deacetylase [Elusimicrobiota bacterium]
MKKLIVNADDFGYNMRINQGIIAAHRNGVVKTTSIMTTKDGFEDALRLSRENPSLAVGLHVDLDRFFVINHEKGVINGMVTPAHSPEEIRAEIKSQIDTLKSRGVAIDHITSHHHSHLSPAVFPLVVDVMKEYSMKNMRFFKKFYSNPGDYDNYRRLLDENRILYPGHFIEGWYWGNIDEEFAVAELMTHPGYGEIWREYELAACCNPKLKEYFKQKGIQVISFSEMTE